MSYPNKRDCEHGSMRGKCNICEYEQDINELELKLGISETEINILKEEITEKDKRIAQIENIAIETAYECFMLACKDKLEHVRDLDKQTASNIRTHELNFERFARSQAERVVIEKLRNQAKGGDV